jgi:tetratricopeptide (TPR) repeat protein
MSWFNRKHQTRTRSWTLRAWKHRWVRGGAALALASALEGCGGTAPLPPAAIALNAAGAEALAAGDLEAATASLEVALEYNPEFVEALSNLGLVELTRGNFARALQLLERAVRLNPEVVQPHHGLGVLAEREHRPDLASRHYREALRLDPGFAPARANLARLLLQSGHVEHALVQYRKLRQVAPGSMSGASGYVECLLLLARIDEAKAELAHALGQFGEAAPLVLLQARLWVHAARLDSARQLLLPLAQGRDDYAVEANAWLGVIALSDGEAELALDAARRALALDDQHPLTLFVAATCLDALDDVEADAWLRRALAANPNNPQLERRIAARSARALKKIPATIEASR